MVYGVTSLAAERATPSRLCAWVRGQWQSANRSPWGREVTVAADRSQARCGAMPQGMAALRKTTLGLVRWAGYSHIAAACRRFVA